MNNYCDHGAQAENERQRSQDWKERNYWNERIDLETRISISRTLGGHTIDLTNLNIGSKLEKENE